MPIIAYNMIPLYLHCAINGVRYASWHKIPDNNMINFLFAFWAFHIKKIDRLFCHFVKLGAAGVGCFTIPLRAIVSDALALV